MHLRGRHAVAADFQEARQLISDSFLYDDDLAGDLFAMWRQIIEGESGYAGVVNGAEGARILAFGISVALKPQFAESIVNDPQPFTSLRILQAWKRGASPIMTREEVAEANAGWGVDLFVLHHGYARMQNEAADYEVLVALAAEFLREHAGLNLRSMTQEFYDRSWLDITPRFGFTLRHDFGKSFIAGIRRSEVMAPDRADVLIDALFSHSPVPRLGLDAEQRKRLRAALEAENAADADVDQSLLEWVRSHPEELHPYLMLDATP
jgi:hypothetical protein